MTWGDIDTINEIDRLTAENVKLRAGMEEYACTGTDKPCGCYELLSEEKTTIAKLRTALAEMIEITKRNSEAGLMLIAIRKCAQHALNEETK